MKREHLFVSLWSILLCFALWKVTSYAPKCNVTCKVETKCECDTSELVKVRKELKQKDSDLYWVVKERNELRAASKAQSVGVDTNVGIRYIPTMDGKYILYDKVFGD